MLQKPTPADFRLSEAAIANAKLIRRLLIMLALAWSVIGTICVAAYFGKDTWGALILLTMPPYGPFIFYFPAKAVARFLVPSSGRAVAYETAMNRYQKWWTRTQSAFWSSLSGRSFEIELASLYRQLGFSAQVTSRDTDKGVDIWIVRNGHRLPIQCKAHRRPVTPGAVRELYGTMQHFGAPAGILASPSGFTRGVAEYAAGKGIELVDLSTILSLQRRLE